MLRLLALNAACLLSAVPLKAAATLESPDIPCATTFNSTTIPFGVWSTAQSPVCVSGTVTAINLTIEAGVRVQLEPDAELVVVNSLQVNGAEGNPVLFTASDPASGWSSVRFESGASSSSVRHAVFEYAVIVERDRNKDDVTQFTK